MSLFDEVKKRIVQGEKKAKTYFGIGKPGMGTFGNEVNQHITQPVKNYFTPTSQVRTRDVIRELPSAGYNIGRTVTNYVAPMAKDVTYAFNPKRLYNYGKFTLNPTERNAQYLINDKPVPTPKQVLKDTGATMLNVASLAALNPSTAGSAALNSQAINMASKSPLVAAELAKAAKLTRAGEFAANVGKAFVGAKMGRAADALANNKNIAKEVTGNNKMDLAFSVLPEAANLGLNKITNKIALNKALKSIVNPEQRAQAIQEYRMATQGGFAKLPTIGESNPEARKIAPELLNTEHAAQIFQELDNSQAGKRINTGNGTTLAQPSSFPKWIPEDLRKTPLVEKVKQGMLNNTRPSGKAGELYDIVHAEIKSRDPLSFLNKENIPGTNQSLSTTPKTVDKVIPEENRVLVRTEPRAPLQAIDKTKVNPLGLSDEQLKTTTAQDYGYTKQPLENLNVGTKKPIQEITQQEADNLANTAMYKAQDKKGFNQLFDKWIAKKEVAKTSGAVKTKELNVPANQSQSVISELEKGVTSNKYTQNIKSAYDDLFKTAEKLGKETGQDISYRQNYLTHIWKDTPQQIEQAFQRMGKKFSFANPREIPTYEEGIKMGLTPKYSNPAQMVGEYVRKLETTQANIGFFNDLKQSGYIVPGSVGYRVDGFVPINAQGFPQNTTSFNGQSITGQWYAPKEIADQINRVFNPQDYGKVGKVMGVGAKISGGAQDILLSGGIPKTPVNAFTIAQTTKELLAGRIKSPIVSMIKSLDGNASQKFFENNVSTIKKMQERNIPFNSEFTIDNIADQGTVKNIFGKSFGEFWAKSVNNPTFKRFMPMLQVNLFNDIEQGALKAGRGTGEAADIAAQAVRNFYGLGSTGKAARASTLGKDISSTFLFAPRYRESMINFWANNVKSLWTTNRNQLMANKTNLSFIVGATATLLAMNKLNQDINGHPMSENPEGKTDKLLIPIGGGKTLGIPFLSSIATVPRAGYNTIKDIAQGDIKGAGKELSSNVSMSLRPLMDVAGNENYFGQQIYDDNATLGQKAKASANYLLNPVTGAYTHPYLREGIKLAQGKQGLAETASKATELPIRWYNTKSIEQAPFWKEYDNQKKIQAIMDSAKYGNSNPQEVEKQLAKVSGKSSVPSGTMIDNGKYVAFKTSKGIQFADTKEEAQLAVEKDKLKNSKDNFKDLGNGTVLRKSKDGNVTDMPKIKYDTELTTQKLENAKTADNLKLWNDLATQQETNLLTQLQDPSLDELEKITIQQQLDKLYADASKFKGYGGFKKPKKAKAAKTLKVTSVTQPKISLVKPQLKAMKTQVGGTSGFKRPQATRKAGSLRLKKGV